MFISLVLMLSEQELEDLIVCKKRVIKLEPTKEKSQANHMQQKVKINSSCHSFEMFIRKCKDLPYDFSIGLLRKGPERTIMLCRYNGNHGIHRNKLENHLIHGYHIHKYNKEYKEAGLSDDAYAEQTELYSSFQGALDLISEEYHIDYSNYLPTTPTGTLFDN